MNMGEFSFISQDVAFNKKSDIHIINNDALLERFLNEKQLDKALLLWLESSSDSPTSWTKDSLNPYLQRVILQIDALLNKQLNTQNFDPIVKH